MAVRTSIAANGDTRLALVTKPRRTTTNGLSFHFGNAVPTPRLFFYQMLHKQGTGPGNRFYLVRNQPHRKRGSRLVVEGFQPRRRTVEVIRRPRLGLVQDLVHSTEYY